MTHVDKEIDRLEEIKALESEIERLTSRLGFEEDSNNELRKENEELRGRIKEAIKFATEKKMYFDDIPNEKRRWYAPIEFNSHIGKIVEILEEGKGGTAALPDEIAGGKEEVKR